MSETYCRGKDDAWFCEAEAYEDELERQRAVMREVAEELRGYANLLVGMGYLAALADRLDPLSVVENPPA